MSEPDDGSDADEGLPAGWSTVEETETVCAWVGPEHRVICERGDDGWSAAAEPRAELGTADRVPLTEGPTGRDEALAAARRYMAEETEE